jgi:hypothetical protein
VTFDVSALTDYQHLQIRYVARSDSAGAQEEFAFRFNGDSGSNYASHRMFGNGSSVFSQGYTSQTQTYNLAQMSGSTSAGNSFACGVIDVLDFSDTSKYTTARCLSGLTDQAVVQLASGLWMNTAAVTSIELVPFGVDFVADSRFSLYGLKAA